MFSAFFFQLADRFLTKIVAFVVSIVMARLLVPEAFGQLAILLAFVNIGLMVVEGGFSTALVQSKNVQTIDYSTVLIIGSCAALFLMALIWVSAPWIGGFFNQPSLIDPLRCSSLILFFGSFNSVLAAKLQRDMNFKGLFVGHVIPSILSGALGILLALYDSGLWALVAYYVSSSFFSCCCFVVIAKWKFSLVFSRKRARRLFSFGWKMLISSLLCGLYANIRSVIIAKKYTADDLAYYDRGRQFGDIGSSTLDSAVQSVMFPVMSRAQDNFASLRAVMQKMLSVSAFMVAPVMLLLAVTSKPLIILLLTEKWLPSVDLMIVLCCSEILIPFVSTNLVALKAVGRSDLYMRLEIVRRLMMLAVLVASVVFFNDVMAIAVGYLISGYIDAIIVSMWSAPVTGLAVRKQFSIVWKTYASALLACIPSLMVPNLFQAPVLICFILQVAVFACVYLLLCLVTQNVALTYAWRKVKNFRLRSR